MTVVQGLRSELAGGWAMLPARSAAGPGIDAFLLGAASAERPVRLAVDARGDRHLLLQTSQDASPPPFGGAMSFETRALNFGSGPEHLLDLACHRPDLFDPFDEVVLDVLELVVQGVRPLVATERVLARWRALLAGLGRQQLGTKAQIGLFAELTVLERLVWRGLADLDAWRGPLGEPHDFELRSGSLEVKGVGASASTVGISSVRQLEARSGTLVLAVLEIAELDDGRTLEELRVSVSGRCEPSRLDGLLARVGYFRADASLYPVRYGIASLRTWTIGQDFPKVTADMFPRGTAPEAITKLVYELALDLLPPPDGTGWEDLDRSFDGGS